MANNSYQFNLFNFGKEHYKITKPIRLIELFAGIGAQAKALEVLGVPFEHYKICEWAYQSIKAYNSIHIKDFADYSANLNKHELIDYLQGNISTDYNTPCDVSKKNEQWLRDTYNNCVATHNLMNIMKTHGKDLEIIDTDKYEYVMTYSFPCQDLSLAGNRQGMATSQADGGTRSGLLWEVERILDELENKPQILLMENVPEVIGTKNVEHFNKWLAKLESLGYSNFFQILNAKDYGIPQNRRRCFMVSILGDCAYDFPLKIKLEYRLKDFLEKQVDEKYYLSRNQIERISNWKAQQNPLKDIEKEKLISPTITARGAGEEHSGMICISEKMFKENEIVDFNSSYKFQHKYGNEIAPTLITKAKFGVCEQKNLKQEMCEQLIKNGRVKENDLRLTIATSDQTKVVLNDGAAKLRIRKLTPTECMRLMGFEDTDTQAMYDVGLSNANIYHCAGDSIVVTCLMGLFGTMLMNEKDLNTKIKEYIKKGIIEDK